MAFAYEWSLHLVPWQQFVYGVGGRQVDKEMDQQLSQYGGVMFHCDFIGMKRRGSLVFLL